MGIQRALTLFPENSTTVDTGTGIDIRALLSSGAGAGENTNFVTAINTDDNVERTFDPASTISTTLDCRSLQKLGYALRLSEDMTPGDDTNCDVVLPAQTVAVSMRCGVGWTGSIVQNVFPAFRCALFRYNPSSDTGTFIADGSASASWSFATDNNTFKTITFNITVAKTTFSTGEILLAQLGVNVGALPNPATGTNSYTFAVISDISTTKLTLASKLVQECVLSHDLVGAGVVSEGGKSAVMSDDLVGAGVATQLMAAALSRSMSGDGAVSEQIAAAMSDDLSGDGVLSPGALAVSMSDDMVGEGTITSPLLVMVDRSMTGEGVVALSKAAGVSVISDLVGEGVLTETHPVTAARTFDLVGVGTILTDVCFPVTAIPTGACPSDWSPNDGLKSISGDVFFHEPPNEGDPVVGATVTLIRDSDGLRITTTLTDAAGHYSFPRDTNDPNTYHVEVNYVDGGGKQQGLSESGCAPS